MLRIGAGLLPRSVLDAMETSEVFAPHVKPRQFDQLLEEYRELRIAFVRQDVFTDLYCCDRQLPAEEIVRQSTCRTGPAGHQSAQHGLKKLPETKILTQINIGSRKKEFPMTANGGIRIHFPIMPYQSMRFRGTTMTS